MRVNHAFEHLITLVSRLIYTPRVLLYFLFDSFCKLFFIQLLQALGKSSASKPIAARRSTAQGKFGWNLQKAGTKTLNLSGMYAEATRGPCGIKFKGCGSLEACRCIWSKLVLMEPEFGSHGMKRAKYGRALDPAGQAKQLSIEFLPSTPSPPLGIIGGPFENITQIQLAVITVFNRLCLPLPVRRESVTPDRVHRVPRAGYAPGTRRASIGVALVACANFNFCHKCHKVPVVFLIM